MIFGLGLGPSFIYLKYQSKDLPRVISVRTPTLEINLFKSIGVNLKWNSGFLDWNYIKESITNNNPVLFLTDTHYLDFYNTKESNFTAHSVVLVGYDEENNKVILSDYIDESLLENDAGNFLNAIKTEHIPFFRTNQWIAVESNFSIQRNLKKMILSSLHRNAVSFLNPNNDNCGLNGIKLLSEEIIFWNDLPNWERCCINAYLSLEKIGTQNFIY
jgi:hypothetical protein